MESEGVREILIETNSKTCVVGVDELALLLMP